MPLVLMPSVMYFEQKMYISAGGMIISIEKAICRFHIVLDAPAEVCTNEVSTPSVNGLRSSELMYTSGENSSFHQKLADMMPTVMKIGLPSGTMTRQYACHRLQPSSMAASSIDSGIETKNWRNKNTLYGWAKKLGRISGQNESSMPKLRNSRY